MGKISRGILGGFSGKVANVVGGSWKGIAYMRALPLSVAQPNTAAQVTQRDTFTNVVEMARDILLTICQPLWNRLAIKMSGYNAFIKQNIEWFDEDGIADYSNILIADGPDTGAAISAVNSADASPTVTIDWIDNSGTGTALGTDLSYAMVINETNGDKAVYDANTERSTTQVTVTMPDNSSSGDVLHAYLAFKSADGLKISASTYMTVAVP